MSPSIHVGQSFSSPWEASNDSMSAPSPVQWPALLPSSRELEPTLALAEFICQVVLLLVGPPSFLETIHIGAFGKDINCMFKLSTCIGPSNLFK